MQRIHFIFFLMITWTNSFSQATEYTKKWMISPPDSSYLISAEMQSTLSASEIEMKWFKDAKFGIFIHWGPALHATDVLSWGRNGERPGANKPATKGVPALQYDTLYRLFDPQKFNADQWMQMISAFGARYLVFTAKHHDGFCLFDAPNTEYDIINTPYGGDICKMVSDAAQKHSINLLWYYSQPDWIHPACLRKDHYDVYLPYMKSHLRHLFSNYGKIHGIFWDGLATKYWHWDSYSLLKELKSLQPGLITNSRCGSGWPDNTNRGDYDTPEQSIGPIDHYRYWESCITMTDKWLYNPDGPVKTSEGLISLLIQVAGNGGNLLLNLGPDSNGTFVQKEVAEVMKVGNWLTAFGFTLFNTRRGVFMAGDWGVSTQKKDKIYLHFLQKRANNTDAVFSLPDIPAKILSVKGINEGFLKMKKVSNGLLFEFDNNAFDKNIDNIVELTIDSDTERLNRIPTWQPKPLDKEDFELVASSFNTIKNHPDVIYKRSKDVFSEGVKLKSWWQPAKGDIHPTLTLNFDEPRIIKTVLLSEHMRMHSVREFEIEVKSKPGQWQKVFTGYSIGEQLRIKLKENPITGIRLRIKESEYETHISTFNVYE